MGEREGDDPRPNDRTTRPGHSEHSEHSEHSGHSEDFGRSEYSGYAGQQAEPSGDPSPGFRPDVGAALAAAVRGGAVDPDAEKRALAAFRQARDEGAHGEARTRRRDDWRPDGERRGGWSLRTTLIALAASVTLGGVAVAAIGSGSGTPDEEGERDRPRPSSTAPAEIGTDAGAPGASGPAGSAGPGRTDGSDGSSDGSSGRPSTAQDTAAHCRAYDSVKERGKALESTAWQRLILAAGGEDNVEAYCAAQLAEAKEKKNTQKAEPTKSAKPSRTPGNGTTNPKSTKSTKSAKSGKSAKSKGG
ncbi:hypothetical protein ACFFS2_11620 [Streptomyces aurantiacus]|nr:hypothetical protein [Streptomyces aurantiacus]